LSTARVALALTASLGLTSCSEEPSPTRSDDVAPAAEQRAVLRGFEPSAKLSFAQITGALGVQVGPDVPPDVVVSLHQLMSRSGYEVKFIRLSAPGVYTINVWGSIPHAAAEFKLTRIGDRWEIIGDSPWVLIGLAGPGHPASTRFG